MENLIWLTGHECLVDDIVRADNCTLVDAAGNRFIDLESGVWCTPIGHSHPQIQHIMASQSGRIVHTGFCYASREANQAAQDVLELNGFQGGSCIFLCSGSEAVEYGVRVAQSLRSGMLLMTMTDAYFGA
ncbi:MAG: aminotransferase class III-fold pyridoxal phosphate-dependent enzyme [Desulfobacterales bacterium]